MRFLIFSAMTLVQFFGVTPKSFAIDSYTIDVVQSSGSPKEDLHPTTKTSVQKKKLSPAQKKARIRRSIKRALEAGEISIEEMDRIERKYLRGKFRYQPHVNTHPYVPRKWDYGLELGGMWLKQDLYWLAGNFGRNIGTCMLSENKACQQYLDLIIGSSGREGVSNYFMLGSLRWQFIDFPKTYSPMARVFAGAMNGSEDDKRKSFPVYGVGVGISSYLHPRADIHWELRFGRAGSMGNFTQIFVSAELKVSRWIEFFAEKLEDAGIGVKKVLKKGVGATGNAIKKGVEAIQPGSEESTEKRETEK